MSVPGKSYTAIGIDPGFDRLGWAIASVRHSSITLVAFGCISTDKSQDYFQRLRQLQTELGEVLDEYSPSRGVIESLFFAKNQTTGIPVAQARGVIIGELIRRSVAISEFTPRQIKQSVTGSGSASKNEMEKMVRLQLKLPEEIAIIDDAIDAIGALITLCARP